MKKEDTLPFERKSHFNEDRDSYLDAHGNYVYTQWERNANGKWERRVVAIIPFSEENRDIIIFLDSEDHDADLADRYSDEHADYRFQNLQEKKTQALDDDCEFDSTPLDVLINRPAEAIWDQLFPDEQPTNLNVERMAEFIRTELTEEQRDLLYAHLGMGKFLEEIRREEEAATGRKITKQAMHNRWNRIITKACKFFGVDKPKQKHKPSK